MVLDIKDKVALVTGGASGVGLRYSKELLRNGARGVTLADKDSTFGERALIEIEKEFGPNKAIFVETDVTDIRQFEDAFKKTVETFKNVDILFNNAGILNDKIWETEIAINVNGVVHGILLGLETYLPKYKQGSEAVIVNISSIAGIMQVAGLPIYAGTKAAVLSMTRSWGDSYHYDRTKVRLITVCPGVTVTPLITDLSGRNLGELYEKWVNECVAALTQQEPEHLAKEVVKLVRDSGNGTAWVIEGGEPAYEYVVPERETMKNNK